MAQPKVSLWLWGGKQVGGPGRAARQAGSWQAQAGGHAVRQAGWQRTDLGSGEGRHAMAG